MRQGLSARARTEPRRNGAAAITLLLWLALRFGWLAFVISGT
jgi:hypothetical protein